MHEVDTVCYKNWLTEKPVKLLRRWFPFPRGVEGAHLGVSASLTSPHLPTQGLIQLWALCTDEGSKKIQADDKEAEGA